MDLAADTGLTIFTYTAEPGSRSEEALKLLGSWAATVDPAEPARATDQELRVERHWQSHAAAPVLLIPSRATDDEPTRFDHNTSLPALSESAPLCAGEQGARRPACRCDGAGRARGEYGVAWHRPPRVRSPIPRVAPA